MNGSLNACMLYPCKIVGICILFISLCLLRLSTLSSLDVLKFSRVILSGVPEKLPFRRQQISRDWMLLDTVVTNCGCPNRTLESF